jgi:hypothetical protein
MVGNLHEAQLVILRSMKLLEFHDNALTMIAQQSANFEMSQAGFGDPSKMPPADQFNVEQFQALRALDDLRMKILARLPATMNWEEYRQSVSRANTQWEYIVEIRDTIAKKNLMAATTPQEFQDKMNDGDSWTIGDWEEAHQKAVDVFYATVNSLNLSPPSNLILEKQPPILKVR